MTPFSNGIKYKADELMYLIFDHSEGRVYEISKSFLFLLSEFGYEVSSLKDIDFKDKKIFIEDILEGFNIGSYVSQSMKRYENKIQIEDVFKLDLFTFFDLS